METLSKSVKKPTPLMASVNVRFEPVELVHLQAVARQESIKRNQDISWSDIVRESVLKSHPMLSTSINPGPILTRNDNGGIIATWNGRTETFDESELELDGIDFDA